MFTFNTTPLFQVNWEATEDIVVNQGGTDSGKTFAILQVGCLICASTKAPDVDPIFSVLAESVPNARKGVWRTVQSIIREPDFNKRVSKVDEGNRIIYFTTGWVMEFLGATDEQNAKQGKRQYLYCNEVNGITWPIFWQMAKRTRIRTWLDYNPSAPFFVHDKFLQGMVEAPSSITINNNRTNDLFATVRLIISDHRHNTYLTEMDHMKTENIKDKTLWEVYARGLTGALSGLIYKSWQEIPNTDYPWDEDKRFAGQDFGYTNDPTAGVRMVKVGNNIFCHEMCYEAGLSAKQLKGLYKINKLSSSSFIYCDHDPDMIRALRKLEVNAMPARKGMGSINAGILKINKDYNVYYTAASKNIAFERARYMWAQDKKTGKLLNEPVEGNDHLMDAIRYGIYTRYTRSA